MQKGIKEWPVGTYVRSLADLNEVAFGFARIGFYDFCWKKHSSREEAIADFRLCTWIVKVS